MQSLIAFWSSVTARGTIVTIAPNLTLLTNWANQLEFVVPKFSLVCAK
jgi:hypothetical protein